MCHGPWLVGRSMCVLQGEGKFEAILLRTFTLRNNITSSKCVGIRIAKKGRLGMKMEAERCLEELGPSITTSISTPHRPLSFFAKPAILLHRRPVTVTGMSVPQQGAQGAQGSSMLIQRHGDYWFPQKVLRTSYIDPCWAWPRPPGPSDIEAKLVEEGKNQSNPAMCNRRSR